MPNVDLVMRSEEGRAVAGVLRVVETLVKAGVSAETFGAKAKGANVELFEDYYGRHSTPIL
jgi:hypothetical protein